MLMNLEVGNLVEPISGRSWSPSEVKKQTALRIGRLQKLGLKSQDRVFIPFGNRLEFFAELLAIWQIGACAIPVDARLTAFEISTLAEAALPTLAIVADDTEQAILDAIKTAGIKSVNTTDIGTAEGSAANIMLDYDALILFTSGSTGAPKGVVHTHRSLRARWMTLHQALNIQDFARTLNMLPTHFGHGLICNCLFPWLSGQDLYITPPFRPDILMRLGSILDEHKITFMSSVPSIWKLALKLSKPPQAGTLKRIHVGSAPLSAGVWEDIRKWSGTRQVCNAYGITETGSWVAGLSDANVDAEDGLVGEGWGAIIKVLNTAETNVPISAEMECAVNEAGYVWLNTPALMKGYFQREDLTANAVSNGWFVTGDIGLINDKGQLVLKGRERDEINKGGMKIYPADVDAVVERFEFASDVCTFANDDAIYGQTVAMAVVLSKEDGATIRKLYEWMKAHLAEPKMPNHWWVVKEIPRTSRGKINREAVKEACLKLQPLDLVSILNEKN